MFLKIKRLEPERDFVQLGEIQISNNDVQQLNRKTREEVKKNNDERIRAIDELGLLDKTFK